MKKILAIVFSVILGCFAFVGCKEDTPDYDGNTVPEVYTISYKAVIDGTEADIPDAMYKEDGSYPTSYTKGVGATVSELQDITVEEDTYDFIGWYLDKNCVYAFGGISTTSMGNATLYAKITVDETVTPPPSVEPEPLKFAITYKAVAGTSIVDIPADMFDDNGSYPTEWNEGETLTVSALKDFSANGGYPVSKYTTYTFVKWYTDSACTSEFGGQLKDLIGEVTLYAKMSVASWTPNY
ncbi:MAG: InlB B-repeat-containing protein [Clostridia bacterium]|nr:InlB B-repeat-containing protein [Clostridia bacterium]